MKGWRFESRSRRSLYCNFGFFLFEVETTKKFKVSDKKGRHLTCVNTLWWRSNQSGTCRIEVEFLPLAGFHFLRIPDPSHNDIIRHARKPIGPPDHSLSNSFPAFMFVCNSRIYDILQKKKVLRSQSLLHRGGWLAKNGFLWVLHTCITILQRADSDGLERLMSPERKLDTKREKLLK